MDLVGQLNINNKNQILFSYEHTWLANGFNISPLDLKMDTAPQFAQDTLFHGLHGIFADSISDGWGLLLVDRALQKQYGLNRHQITPLDRLNFIGHHGMGALRYEPVLPHEDINNFNLEQIFEENMKIIQGDSDDVIKELYLSGGSPNGAWPKAVFARNCDSFISGYNEIPLNYEGWIVKFFSEEDNKDTGKIEKAYSDMAMDCGLIMMETDLIHTKIKKKDCSFFATKRFDRDGNDRIHIASLSGLTYASHRMPTVSYKDIFNLTQSLCLENTSVELDKLFNLMLFNIIMHNKDDHTKNFSFMYDQTWKLAPAYDLVFSHSFSNQHMTDIGGNGNPDLNDVLSIAKLFNIKNVEDKIERFIDISNQWTHYADKYKVNTKAKDLIEKDLNKIQNRFVNKYFNLGI